MKRLIGAAVVAGALALAGPAAIKSAAAAAPQIKAQIAGDIRCDRLQRAPLPPALLSLRLPAVLRPYYYARPHYYRPYPYYAPAPFVFGFGFGPFWW